MDGKLLDEVGREVLLWDGVFQRRDENGIGGMGVTGYRFGEPETGGPQLGHVHDNGRADLRLSAEDYEKVVSEGRTKPHIFRNTVTYRIATEEDVPKVVELFRLNYRRLRERAERESGARR